MVSDDVHIAEECDAATSPSKNNLSMYKLHTDSAVLDQHGSPKRKQLAMLSGHKHIDHLIHTIINYILRDFIDSWFISLSDNKEFSEFRTRNCIEESVQNICGRIKNTQWIPLMTTKLVDHVAQHARLYRLANDTVNLTLDDNKNSSQVNQPAASSTRNNEKSSPQRQVRTNSRLNRHRRNKSDTDLNWYLGNQSINRNIGNSKFFDADGKSNDKQKVDPETKLINAFFNQCDLYRVQCLDEHALEGLTVTCD